MSRVGSGLSHVSRFDLADQPTRISLVALCTGSYRALAQDMAVGIWTKEIECLLGAFRLDVTTPRLAWPLHLTSLLAYLYATSEG